MRLTIEERFWAKVDKRGPDECWPWTGSRASGRRGRYGKLNVRPYGNIIASRLSWELANGCEVPDGMLVLHECDNPPCVNPKHLHLGTTKDNSREAVERGRIPRKLTDDDERAIRTSYLHGESQRAIAIRFGIGQAHVSRIVRGTRNGASDTGDSGRGGRRRGPKFRREVSHA